MSRNSHRRNAQGGDGRQRLEQVAQDVDHGDVDDSLELAEHQVCQHGPEDGRKVAEHGEGVVDHLADSSQLQF